MRNSSRLSLSSILGMAAIAVSGLGMAQQSGTNTGRTVSTSAEQGADRTQSNRPVQQPSQSQADKFMRRAFGGGGSSRRSWPGPGWTHAKVQRMARKKKNQASNRKAHR